MSNLLKNSVPHIVAIVVFLIVNAVYFTDQVNGKVIQAGDTISSTANQQEIMKYYNENGELITWTNALFGGMPTYQIRGSNPGNLIQHVEKLMFLYISRPIGYFFASMLAFYIMLILLKVNPWLSLLGAVAFGLTTNNFILFSAGHMTKIRVINYLGLLTAGVILAFRQHRHLLGAVVFALGFALVLYVNHIQMVYYFFLTLLIYGIIELVWHIRNNQLPQFGKAVLYLTVAGVLAIGSSASKLWTTYEYGKDTMRGAPILAAETGKAASSSTTDGLEYGYATRWSNGYMDLVAGFIPGVIGGGGVTYWGANDDGTAGPAYYGAVVFLLFILGLLVVKGPVKWWMLGGFILISLLSMGKNFNALYQTLFDYFPLFNKFRTPNSALSVVAFIVPALGFLGLSQIIKTEKDKVALLRPLYIAAGALGAICLFFALLGSGFFDFAYVKDQAYAQNYNINLDALKTQRAEMMSTDSWRSLGLIAASSVLLWLFLKSKINQTILLAGLAVLTIGDLWSVNKKYLNSNNFVEASQYRQVFSQRPVDTKILADKDPHYRVFDITKGLGGAVNSSDASYYHKNIGGYHPAKLQRYQDVLDYHILPEGQQLISTLQQSSSLADIQSKMGQMRALNMLNTKYIIVNNETPIPNNTAYGNAWFVNGVQMVNTPNEEINAIRNIDPQQTAIVNNEFSNYVAGMNFNKNGSIQLTGYHPQKLSYQSNSSSDQLAVFSEVWYGPDKGWQAMIDGNPVEHIRVNYLLRALKVPAGQHTIEFVFNPSSYRVGTTISLISSLAIILGLLGFVGFRFYQQSQQPAPVPAKPTKPATKAKLKPTTSTKKKKSKGKKS